MQTIGVDLAKNVFELAISDGRGRITGRRRLTRAQFERFWINQPAARVVMEACSGAHHWARTLLGMGFEVILLPPRYVTPTVAATRPIAPTPKPCSRRSAAPASSPSP